MPLPPVEDAVTATMRGKAGLPAEMRNMVLLCPCFVAITVLTYQMVPEILIETFA
jgi:hypothetical protein